MCDLQALEIARACRDMLGGNGIQVEYRPRTLALTPTNPNPRVPPTNPSPNQP